jgi:predicted permease
MEELTSDFRHATRRLRKTPVLTTVALLVIALGTGGVTTIFSGLSAVALRPLPGAAEPGRLIVVERTRPDRSGSVNASHVYYLNLRDRSRTLEGMAAWSNVTLSIAVADEGHAAVGNIVSGNYFAVLGVRPALGRFFGPEEDRSPLAHPVVVVSHDFWRTRLGADPAVVGRNVSVNGQPFTLIGVAPARFQGVFTVLRTDAWVPLMMQPLLRPDRELSDPTATWLRLFGRLRDDADWEAASAELSSLTAAYAVEETGRLREFDGVSLTPMTGMPPDAHRAAVGFMGLLLATAGLVLLIASVNVAGLLAADAIRRRHEMAVRLALGAVRGRLVRQLLSETLLLFCVGTAGGVGLAWLATGVLSRTPVRGGVPIPLEVSLDVRALGFALGIALTLGLICGLSPALRATRSDLTPTLRTDATRSGARRPMLGDALVVGQLTASLVLLVIAGLFLRALNHGRSIDTGFEAAGVATARLNTLAWGYDEDRGRAFYRDLLDAVRSQPGVTSVSTAGYLPLAGGTSGGTIGVDGDEVEVQSVNVGPGYFDVLRLPIVGGRAFEAADDESAPAVAVINESLARRQWPGRDAVGASFTARGGLVRVVGIARDAKYLSLTETTPSFVYYPMAQSWNAAQTLVVRTAGTPVDLGPALRGLIHDLDPSVPPPAVTTLEQETSLALMPQRVAVSVTGALGLLGLLLAAVGLYGVMAFSSSRRAREIGIRVALGARRGDVARMVAGRGVMMAGLGVLIGLPLAALTTRATAGLLLGVGATDWITMLCSSGLFLAVAVIASWLPARRAAAVDAMEAMRGD